MPPECMGDRADLPVVDGPMQGVQTGNPSAVSVLPAGGLCSCNSLANVQVNDVEVDGGKVGKGQGVLVERYCCCKLLQV